MRAARGTVTVVGGSMRPMLGPGTRVSIRSLSGPPRLGSVLVYSAADRLVVHRLVRIQRRGERITLVTKGDLSLRCDAPLRLERVLGEAVRIETRWFSLPVDNHACRAIGWLFTICAPAAVALVQIGRWSADRVVRTLHLVHRSKGDAVGAISKD